MGINTITLFSCPFPNMGTSMISGGFQLSPHSHPAFHMAQGEVKALATSFRQGLLCSGFSSRHSWW